MRTRQAFNNVIYGLGSSVANNILGFVSRTVFIHVLGATYLGVNGLFSNVLSMLSLADLGVGTAIGFSLYKPIATRDFRAISALMGFYKRAYQVIGSVIAALGIGLMFFLPHLIKHAETIPNLNIIYILFLANSVFGYFISYKNTLITADQMGYKLVPLQTGLQITNTLVLIVILFLTKEFIVYLAFQILLSMMVQIAVNVAITKKYPDVDFNDRHKLPKEELDTITTNVKAMFFHKMGDYCINGTDNLVISAYVNISSVGLYSNYLMLITLLNKYIMVCFNNVQASFGNLLATETVERKLETFKAFNLLGFWLFSWISICFYNLLTPFILLWIGNKYELSNYVLFPVVINYYLTGMRVPLGIIKAAGGVYDQDKFSPLIQSAVNLVFSILLVKTIGLAGVFWGTVISCVVPLITRPFVVYKYIFKRSSIEYYMLYIYYFIIFSLGLAITTSICNHLFRISSWPNLIGRGMICTLVPNLLLLSIFGRQAEFRYITGISRSLLRIKWKRKSAL